MNECNIIKDLLPLYAEELTSPDSGEFIEKHLASCADCRDTWRRYREELPKMEVNGQMTEKYKQGLKKDKLKITVMTLLGWLLVAAITAAVYFYSGWENGDFEKGKLYASPDGVRGIELVDLDDAGFFNNDGSLLKFRFEKGYVNRYQSDWQDLTVHWAPDSQTSLLVIINAEGEEEMRIVDHKGGLPDGGTQEIPGLIPSETEPDLTQVLADLCAEQGVEAFNFEFKNWSNDSLQIWFDFETVGNRGSVLYDYKAQRIIGPIEYELMFDLAE